MEEAKPDEEQRQAGVFRVLKKLKVHEVSPVLLGAGVDTRTLAVRDPLQHGVSQRGTAYYRLPGPAGHKSRYEDPAIERLAEIAQAAEDQDAHYVFTNVDMFADGRRFKRAMGL